MILTGNSVGLEVIGAETLQLTIDEDQRLDFIREVLAYVKTMAPPLE